MKQYNEYKDSGVKWIGEIPRHWEAVQLRRITKTVRTGTTPSGVSEIYFNKTGLCWFTPSDFENNYYLLDSEKHLSALGEKKVKIFPKNSILMIGIGGTMGKVALAKVQCASNQQINAIIPNNNINPMFLVYYLKCMQDNIFKTARFTTLPILNQLETKKIPIPIPPLSEQQAIVSYLDNKVSKIDNYIVTAEKKMAALDELKQVTIADAVTHGINPNVPMKDSGIPWIGMVPKHWDLRRMKFLFNEISEKGHPNEPCLCSTQKYGVIPQSLYENRVVVVNKGLENLKFVRIGNFVISLRSFQGGIEMAHYQGIISAAYTVLALANNKLTLDYVKFLFKSTPYIQLLQTCVTGIREGQNINYELLRKQFLPTPPLSEQAEIVSYIDRKVAQIDKMKAAELAQIEKLKEYKQRLISDVVTGKVKVTND